MHTPAPLGMLVRLWRYPVKSLRPEVLERAEIGEHGLLGDRRAALFVRTPDVPRSGQTYRGKEHNLLHTVASPGAARALAAQRHVDLEERSEGPYFDTRPVSLLMDRWLLELSRMLGFAVDPQRFRPNLFVAGEPDFEAAEEELVGALLGIGTVRLRVVQPNLRCVTTTYDLDTGTSDPRVLRAIAQQRDNVMGVYCTVETPGVVRLGETLRRL
ncbi:MAG TPA: MOSC domain-containing protein [Candidatus Baltobacteraceae bacterium]|nr:MOSC domain-containing protein [Candidatus Baltobacteraceae bacterium]